MVKSVRGIAGRWNPEFPDAEGAYTAFLEFDDGVAAPMAFNGYGFFDITELTWSIGEGGQLHSTGITNRERFSDAVDPSVKYAWAATRFDGEAAPRPNDTRHQPFFGLTLASCQQGDIRQSPDGLYLYTNDGRSEVVIDSASRGRGELSELRDALDQERPTFPDARWGMASLEVILAIRQSSNEHREITLSHQVPVPF